MSELSGSGKMAEGTCNAVEVGLNMWRSAKADGALKKELNAALAKKWLTTCQSPGTGGWGVSGQKKD